MVSTARGIVHCPTSRDICDGRQHGVDSSKREDKTNVDFVALRFGTQIFISRPSPSYATDQPKPCRYSL